MKEAWNARKVLRAGFVLAFGAIVGACGGGSDAAPAACSSQSAFVVSVSWNSNGSVGSTVTGKVGVPLSAVPSIGGVPSSCLGQETFAIATSLGLPAGLALNTRTGVISGTPTVAISEAGPAGTGLVTVQYPGYAPVQALGVITITP